MIGDDQKRVKWSVDHPYSFADFVGQWKSCDLGKFCLFGHEKEDRHGAIRWWPEKCMKGGWYLIQLWRLRRVRDSRRWGFLTMVSAGKKAKRLSSVNYTTKTIHHHYHHHHHHHLLLICLQGHCQGCWSVLAPIVWRWLMKWTICFDE